MSDETLRDLERRAREQPSDHAAGLAYARALERAGDERAAFYEYARLTRLGCPEAAIVYDDRLPAPSAYRRRAHRTTERELFAQRPRVAARALFHRRVSLIAASRSVVFVCVGDDELVALSARDLSRLWQANVEELNLRAAWALGPDFVHADGEMLVVRDAATGSTRQLLGVGGSVGDLAFDGDRAVLMQRHHDHTDVVGLSWAGGRGREVWRVRRDRTAKRVAIVGEMALLVTENGSVEATRLADGSSVWTSPTPMTDHAHDAYFGAADSRGAIVVSNHHEGRRANLRELDIETGSIRWHHQIRAGPVVATVGRESVVFLRDDGSTLEAIRRSDGSTMWTASDEGLRSDEDVFLAGQVLYVTVNGEDNGRPFTLRSFDVKSGVRVADHAIEAHRPYAWSRLIGLGDGLLIMRTAPRTDLWLLRDDTTSRDPGRSAEEPSAPSAPPRAPR